MADLLTSKIDLLIWPGGSAFLQNWNYGQVAEIPEKWEEALSFISRWANNSSADFLLIWQSDAPLPIPDVIRRIIQSEADVAHCGILQGFGSYFEELGLLGFSWDKINAPVELKSTNWRINLNACLIRREIYLLIGGLDPVFESPSAAGLEFGYRCLKLGGVVEHDPGLYTGVRPTKLSEPTAYDFYCFVLRHYGIEWGKYVFFRKLIKKLICYKEFRCWNRAKRACSAKPMTWSYDNPVWRSRQLHERSRLHAAKVSVIIPTLGRYNYLPGALNSLLRQTVLPSEVIVVDQNPPETRRPEVYIGFDPLNLKIIWQNERGQSLARNTGLLEAKCPYILFFDDDSIANDDLIERHLETLLIENMDISTGVSYPPPPQLYSLPKNFRFPRLSQTFDTGNSLLPLDLAKKVGGLDRNYDFGPGTDADFGTRLYLAGYRILHNPMAIRIHFKAEMGGLRVHGSKKYNTDAGILKPFPPITQSYYALRYMNKFQQKETAWLLFMTNKFNKEFRQNRKFFPISPKLFLFMLSLIFYPIKIYRSRREAKKLIDRGILLHKFVPKDNTFAN